MDGRGILGKLKLNSRRDRSLWPERVVVARTTVLVYIFCTFFGVLTILFQKYLNKIDICWLRIPKLTALDEKISDLFCASSNLLILNFAVFSVLYAAVYIIAVPIWVIAARSRRDWSDLRFKGYRIAFIGSVFLCAALEIYGYLFGDVKMFGQSPKLAGDASLDYYSRFQVIVLMGPVNFLVFGGTLFIQGTIFGRGIVR